MNIYNYFARKITGADSPTRDSDSSSDEAPKPSGTKTTGDDPPPSDSGTNSEEDDEKPGKINTGEESPKPGSDNISEEDNKSTEEYIHSSDEDDDLEIDTDYEEDTEEREDNIAIGEKRKREKNRQRQKKWRKRLSLDEAKKKAHDLYRRELRIKNQRKELMERIESAFVMAHKEAVEAGTIKHGFHFVVPRVAKITANSVRSLKSHLAKQGKWSGLHQTGRYYNKKPTKNTTTELDDICCIFQEIFDKGKRIDTLSWHVHGIKYIKHTEALVDRQGFHVDIQDHYHEMAKMEVKSELTFNNHGGYSVFIGLEIQNTLFVGYPDESNSDIINRKKIIFPFKSILVISDYLPHDGDRFCGKHVLHHNGNKETMYHLKGFISINELGDEDATEQGWFNVGEKPFITSTY
jgi:hypothetical protein